MVENYSNLPKTRKEAIKIGSLQYFTGKVCRNGHLRQRATSNGCCFACKYDVELRYRSTEGGRAAIRGVNNRYGHTDRGRAVKKALSAERRALKKRAAPSWCDDASVREFYRECPSGHHVDHIIPLNGDNMCGLHVLANLQYLPAQNNLEKSNKVIPITLEYAVCPITTSGTIV